MALKDVISSSTLGSIENTPVDGRLPSGIELSGVDVSLRVTNEGVSKSFVDGYSVGGDTCGVTAARSLDKSICLAVSANFVVISSTPRDRETTGVIGGECIDICGLWRVERVLEMDELSLLISLELSSKEVT